MILCLGVVSWKMTLFFKSVLPPCGRGVILSLFLFPPPYFEGGFFFGYAFERWGNFFFFFQDFSSVYSMAFLFSFFSVRVVAVEGPPFMLGFLFSFSVGER